MREAARTPVPGSRAVVVAIACRRTTHSVRPARPTAPSSAGVRPRYGEIGNGGSVDQRMQMPSRRRRPIPGVWRRGRGHRRAAVTGAAVLARRHGPHLGRERYGAARDSAGARRQGGCHCLGPVGAGRRGRRSPDQRRGSAQWRWPSAAAGRCRLGRYNDDGQLGLGSDVREHLHLRADADASAIGLAGPRQGRRRRQPQPRPARGRHLEGLGIQQLRRSSAPGPADRTVPSPVPVPGRGRGQRRDRQRLQHLRDHRPVADALDRLRRGRDGRRRRLGDPLLGRPARSRSPRAR